MKTVAFHPAARLEIFEGATWYEEKREGLGARFVAAVTMCAEAVPFRAHLRPLPQFSARGVKVCALSRWPYRIIVVERPMQFVVLAVAHNRRLPDYWASRLDD